MREAAAHAVLAAALVGAAASASAVDCTKSRPETVVADLYMRHGGPSRPAARASLSAPLRRLVDKVPRPGAASNPSPAFDWSPWAAPKLQAGVERVLVTDTLIEGRRASTRLSYGNEAASVAGAEKLFAELQLVREPDGCWRVDDIVRDRSSLRAALLSSQGPP